MRWPGQIQAGMTSKQVMTVLDVFPTLAGAVGVTARNQQPFDGRNLWAQIARGRQQSREDLFFAVENAGMIHLAVHHREWKLVRQVPSGGGEAVNMLFRIDDDPGETRELASEQPDRVKDLINRIEKWQALHPAEGTRFAAAAPLGWKSPAQWAEAAR
jgi:arylsulfatase A-like enzyme